MSENVTPKKKVNKKPFIIVAVVSVVLVLGYLFGLPAYKNYRDDTQKEHSLISYEVLDESVLDTDELEKWLETGKKEEGFYVTSDDSYTYILISGGVKETTGYGISLEEITGDKKTIKIAYQVIEPENPNVIESKEIHPAMVIRLPKDNRQVKQIPFEKIEE